MNFALASDEKRQEETEAASPGLGTWRENNGERRRLFPRAPADRRFGKRCFLPALSGREQKHLCH